MRIGGSGPRSAARSSPERAIASSGVFPFTNSVARLATAIAVSHPKVWKVARSITFLPFSSLNLIHIRTMSPQFGLPTVPTASGDCISPMFLGFAIASAIFACRSFSILLKLIFADVGIDFAPGVDASFERTHISETMPEKVRGRVHALGAKVIVNNDQFIPWPSTEHLGHDFLREQNRSLNLRCVKLLAGADIHQPHRDVFGAPARQFLGSHINLRVCCVTLFDMLQHFGDIEVIISGADLPQCFIRIEPATRTATNVIFAEQRSLGARKHA